MINFFAQQQDSDVRGLLADARTLFEEAGKAHGAKAEELYRKGLELLDAAVSDTQDSQVTPIITRQNKTCAPTINHPWRIVAISTGILFLARYFVSHDPASYKTT